MRYLEFGRAEFQRFYDLHRPSNALAANFIFDFPDKDSPPEVFAGKPWGRSWPKPKGAVGQQAWGPASSEFIASEALRLQSIRASIMRDGLLETSNPIRFQLLIDDSGADSRDHSYRVLVVEGKHRVAVLAHLGWTHVPMRPVNTPDREIRFSDANQWDGVASGIFTVRIAKQYFMAYFRDAKKLLLPEWGLPVGTQEDIQARFSFDNT